MTRASAKAIEGSTKLTGIQRDWVKAYVEEVVKEEIAKLRAELLEVMNGIGTDPDVKTKLNNALTRIGDLENRYSEDDKFTLTRAKLLRFMKEQGL
tara:strand:+ start:847 stop:1134 length:288 start_codon:yes stop_codon:yes gene_type:complete